MKASNVLGAFISEVLALMPPPDPGDLSTEQGRLLIDLAEQAVGLLGA